MRETKPSLITTAIVCAALLVATSCTSELGDEVFAGAVAYDQTATALKEQDIQFLQGYYINCRNREDGARWAVKLEGDGETVLTAAERLAVVTGDGDCELYLDEVVLSSGTYVAEAHIKLEEDYLAANATGFAKEGEGIFFFANASIDMGDEPVLYRDDFDIVIIFSDDPRPESDVVAADLTVIEGGYDESMVAAPNYGLTSALTIAVNQDDEIVSVMGEIHLDVATDAGERILGQQFVVWDHADENGQLADYDGVFSLWADLSDAGGDGEPLSDTLEGEDPDYYVVIDYDEALFKLLNEDVGGSVKRTILIRNLNEDAGVPAFQFFTITFNPPGN